MGYNLQGNFLGTVLWKGPKISPAASCYMVCGDRCTQVWVGLEISWGPFQTEFCHDSVMIWWKFFEDFHPFSSSPGPKLLLALCRRGERQEIMYVTYIKKDIHWSCPYTAGNIAHLFPSLPTGSDKVWIVWRKGFCWGFLEMEPWLLQTRPWETEQHFSLAVGRNHIFYTLVLC